MSSGNSMTVRKAGAHLGAEVSGIDLREAMDEVTFIAVHDALAAHQILVFRDQDITAEHQIAFGRRFGELSVHPFSPNDPDRPELIILDNDPDNPPNRTDVWHADETFRAAPPMATVLRAVQVPEVGGDTCFASMTAAYDGLSMRMKAYISGLKAEHDFLPFRALFGGDPESLAKLRKIEDAFPRVRHPLVRIHPVTGRKTLYVNRQFVTHVVGMKPDESRYLLEYLFSQCQTPEYQFRVQWRPGTLIIWDNRSVLHYAANDYFPHRRIMERVTIAGDVPVGDESLFDDDADAADTGPYKKSANRPVRHFARG